MQVLSGFHTKNKSFFMSTNQANDAATKRLVLEPHCARLLRVGQNHRFAPTAGNAGVRAESNRSTTAVTGY